MNRLKSFLQELEMFLRRIAEMSSDELRDNAGELREGAEAYADTLEDIHE